MATIKKTMVEALAFVTENGNMSADNLELFTSSFCIAKSGAAGSNGPKPLTILRDGSDVATSTILGRLCSVTHKFFIIDRFAKNTSCIKEADAAKGKLYNESKQLEKAAQTLLDEARDIADIEEKVAKFEEYDQALINAAEVRKTPVEVQDEWLDGSFDTIEELASDLGVEVIKPIAPVKVDVGDDTEEV